MSGLPVHLEPIDRIKYKCGMMRPDDSEYADIAFALLKVKDGDSEALNEVTEYIKSMYRQQKQHYETLIGIKSDIEKYIEWAKIWTIKKETE